MASFKGGFVWGDEFLVIATSSMQQYKKFFICEILFQFKLTSSERHYSNAQNGKQRQFVYRQHIY